MGDLKVVLVTVAVIALAITVIVKLAPVILAGVVLFAIARVLVRQYVRNSVRTRPGS